MPQHITLIRNILKQFPDQSFDIKITSAIPPTYGFGSSAALVAALVKALFRFYKRDEDFKAMFETGHRAILDTFHRGSGADLAAALADMPLLVFDPLEKSVTPFAMPFGISAIYTGYKTPTPVVLQKIKAEVPPAAWRDLTRKMKACAEAFIANPTAEGVREYQSYMDALGVTCGSCRLALDAFEAAGAPAKISGSGLGDCVVGFTTAPAAITVVKPLEFMELKSC